MKSDEARKIVERLYEALHLWDVDTLTSILDPAFVGTITAGLPLGIGGVYSGPEPMISGVWAQIGRHYIAVPEPDSFMLLEDGSLLVRGTYTGHGRASGRQLDAAYTHVIGFHGDLISSLDQVTDSARWVDALGESDTGVVESNAEDPVTYSFADGVATITLNRPGVRNALGQVMANSILEVALRLTDQPGLRAVLIAANGPTFTVGGDISDFAQAAPAEMSALLIGMVSPYHRALGLLDSLPAPIVCAVQGAAAGGGLGLLHVSDIVIASEKSKFAAGFAGIGLTGDGGSTWFMPKLIGAKRAAEFYLEQRVLTAAEAVEWGLITRVVETGNLLEEATATAAKLAAGPTVALGRVRKLLRQGWDVPFTSQLAAEGEGIALSASTRDAASAVAGFLAKQAPTFIGE